MKDAGYSAEAIKPSAPGSLSCSGTLRGKCSEPHPSRRGNAAFSSRGARRLLPVSSSHCSGRASRDRALRLLSPFPSPAHRCSGRLLPPLLQQPTSNRPLGATAQAPATRLRHGSARARKNVVTTAQRGLRACYPQKNLDFSLLIFSSAHKGLNPNPNFFRHAQQAGLRCKRRTVGQT